MPAPTALVRAPESLAMEDDQAMIAAPPADNDDFPVLDPNALPSDTAMAIPETTAEQEAAEEALMELDTDRPSFAPAKESGDSVHNEMRKIPIPPHRRAALRRSWKDIYSPLVEFLLLQVRYDTKSKAVWIRTSKATTDVGALQKGDDFLRAFTLGFELEDAIALLRLDDLYIQSFEIKDVKTLEGEHLSRCIGRISGKDGKTKFAIENASRTRVVLADSKIHILGGFKNIGIAREAIVSLILGAPPGKVYGNLRTVASRMKERF